MRQFGYEQFGEKLAGLLEFLTGHGGKERADGQTRDLRFGRRRRPGLDEGHEDKGEDEERRECSRRSMVMLHGRVWGGYLAATFATPASFGARRAASSAAAFCSAVLAAVCSEMSTATLVSRSTARILPSALLCAFSSMRALQETRLARRTPSALKASPVISMSALRAEFSSTIVKPHR